MLHPRPCREFIEGPCAEFACPERANGVEGVKGVERVEESISSTASQSSNSGLVGGLPAMPKSKTVGTSGSPKWRIQMWFTATRAASGLSRAVIHRASARRRPVLVEG